MFSYFRGWKRKAGLVTLVIACVFAGLWVRSLLSLDQVRYGNLSRTPLVLLQNGPPGFFFLDWCNMEPAFRNCKFEWRSHPMTEQLSKTAKSTSFLGDFFYRWVTKPSEIAIDGYKEYSRFGFRLRHRTIVVPLTLLSAWLLLGKPRSKPQPTPTSR